MTVLTEQITSLTIDGNSISNAKYVRWDIVHSVTPQLLPSSKYPVGAFQGHIWVEGVIGLLTHDSNLVAPSTADAPEVSFVFTVMGTDGNTMTFTFTGTRITKVSRDLGAAEPIFVYSFQSYYCVES